MLFHKIIKINILEHQILIDIEFVAIKKFNYK